MTLPEILGDYVVFFGLVFGLGLPWIVQKNRESVETLTLAAACGVLQIYVWVWTIFVAGLPAATVYLLPVVAAICCMVHRRSICAFLEESDTRSAIGRLLLFSGWCLGWLALVRSYGGGEWTGDWFEHFDRAKFFIDDRPLDTQFLGIYGLTSRPPLANLVAGAGLALRGSTFAHAQVFMTLFSTLLLLPVLLLARHFSGTRRADAALLVIMMFNPLVIQNSTFLWTKLPCAFFVATSLALYVRALDDTTFRLVRWSAAAMAGGVLAHYSAAPYAAALILLHVARTWMDRRRGGIWQELGVQAIIVAALLGTWIGWALIHFGWAGTFLDNTSVKMGAGLPIAERLSFGVRALWVTLVPHPLLPVDYRFIAQTSSVGFARDYAFNIYQTTLPGAIGLGGLVCWVLCRGSLRGGATKRAERVFWTTIVTVVSILTMAAISGPDRWGIVHITLIPLVVTGLAWLAAASTQLPSGARMWWLGALGCDAVLGIVAHFYLQATVWLTEKDLAAFFAGREFTYSIAVGRNAMLKLMKEVDFIADGGPHPVLVTLLLLALGTLALKPVLSPASPVCSG